MQVVREMTCIIYREKLLTEKLEKNSNYLTDVQSVDSLVPLNAVTDL